jgi:Uma2 family endonuclease
MSTTKTRITAEEYFELTADDPRSTWLVEGEIVVSQPKFGHGLLHARIVGALLNWTEAKRGRGAVLTTTGVIMDDYNVYGPDGLWIAEKHLPEDRSGYPERVPDLCIEIRSESTWRYDVGAKKRIYEAGGLPELWLVDDRGEVVLVYRRSKPSSRVFDVELELAAGDTLTSPQLPGFALPLEKLFSAA